MIVSDLLAAKRVNVNGGNKDKCVETYRTIDAFPEQGYRFPPMVNVPQASETQNGEEPPRLFTRRDAINVGLAGVASLALLLLRNEAKKAEIKNDNEGEEKPPRNAEILSLLKAHPAAEVRILQNPRSDDASLVIAIEESGSARAETIWHLHDNGWMERRRESRREHPAEFSEEKDESDIVPSEASGFITEHAGHAYVVSNEHVFSGTAKPFEDLITSDAHRDIAVAPGEIVARCSGDEYELPFVPVSETLRSADLQKRTVRIRGMGSQLYEITGKPVLLESCINGDPKCESCNGKLALVVETSQLQQEDLIGMSGSRVEDVETGDVVGIFDSAPSVTGLNGRFLMKFSGPEDVRSALTNAAVRRTQDQARYDLQTLLKQSGNPVPPAPEL